MNTIYRAQVQVWIFGLGLSGLPWLAVAGNAYAMRGIDAAGVILASVVTAFVFAWLICFRIVLTPTEVIFHSLPRGRQSIRHDQIKLVRLIFVLKQTRGPFRLVIEPRDGSGARELDINAKVFSMKAIDAVLALGARVAQADDGGLRAGILRKKLKGWLK
jgi:hypothetical protein